jgi:dTDP-4-amino-4,6-dideoxygalactose transaminase
MENDYIVFGSPMIGEEEISEVVDSMRSGWLGTGPKVAKFESLVKKYTGADYSVALNSCTACLHLSLLASGIGEGDEVITTPLTFCATVNAIVHSGAKPVLVDIDVNTLNIDEKKIEEVITSRTKAIIPVHMAGRPCNMDVILEIAKKHNLVVIEDAAHAIGAEYKGRRIGSISDITCFSFYVTKNIVTGEGGMITTNNKDIADKIKVYGLHGMSKDAWSRYSDDGYKHYEVIYPGYKYNMMDLQAAIGMHQVKRIDAYNKKRSEIWDYYNKNLNNLNLTLPFEIDKKEIKHAKHLYTVLVDKDKTGITRDQLMNKLHIDGIGTGVHFFPVHLHKYYRERYGWKRGDFPNAEYVGDRILSIPLSAKLTINDAEKICRSIKNNITNNI